MGHISACHKGCRLTKNDAHINTYLCLTSISGFLLPLPVKRDPEIEIRDRDQRHSKAIQGDIYDGRICSVKREETCACSSAGEPTFLDTIWKISEEDMRESVMGEVGLRAVEYEAGRDSKTRKREIDSRRLKTHQRLRLWEIVAIDYEHTHMNTCASIHT